MGNENRFRYPDNGHISVAVDSAVVIAVGDLVYLDTDDAKPASTAALWNANEATTQADLKNALLGVAMDASIAGDTDKIRIMTRGVFEFDATSAAYEVGDLVGAIKDSGDTLIATTVASAVAASAIGIVQVSSAGVSVTRVIILINAQVPNGIFLGE